MLLNKSSSSESMLRACISDTPLLTTSLPVQVRTQVYAENQLYNQKVFVAYSFIFFSFTYSWFTHFISCFTLYLIHRVASSFPPISFLPAQHPSPSLSPSPLTSNDQSGPISSCNRLTQVGTMHKLI